MESKGRESIRSNREEVGRLSERRYPFAASQEVIVDETDSESERMTAVGSLRHWKNCAGRRARRHSG
jgi:hypothetical protein